MTLIEVLVVAAIITLLAAVLLPSLSAARERSRSVVCASNIRQVVQANELYANHYRRRYCPGAAGFLRNLHRWHGRRKNVATRFEPGTGPLHPYLGQGGGIRQCPTFPADEIALESGGFERGNGGYGYNNAYIGVDLRRLGSDGFVVASDRVGALADRVRQPAETIMFTDSAFAADSLIEYSFAEPRFHPQYKDSRAAPSIHFRHHGLANIGWCDGHVNGHRMTFTRDSKLYRAKSSRFDIGWPGKKDDNSLFDLE